MYFVVLERGGLLFGGLQVYTNVRYFTLDSVHLFSQLCMGGQSSTYVDVCVLQMLLWFLVFAFPLCFRAALPLLLLLAGFAVAVAFLLFCFFLVLPFLLACCWGLACLRRCMPGS